MNGTELLTPRAAALAKELEFFARTRVEGLLRSANPSKLKGQSTDFMQHRPYVPGDDLRRIDWRAFARTDRIVSREYEEHTNLDIIIGLDCSGSMGYPTTGFSKLDFCRHCAAMLGYLLMTQRDAFGMGVLTDRVARFVRPASSRKHFAQTLRILASLSAESTTDLPACIRHLLSQVRRRSVFIFLSDCYQDPVELTRAAAMLIARGHDVVLYHVYDADERSLPMTGFTLFRDLETGAVDAADPMEIRSAYREVFDEHIRQLKRGASGCGIEFHSVPVSNDWDDVLARLLRERTQTR